MEALIAKTAMDGAVKGFSEEIGREGFRLFKEIYASGKAYFEAGLKDYIEKKYKSISLQKTLLRGNSPCYFYDTYYPLHIQKSRERGKVSKGGGHTTSAENTDKLFKQSNFITLIGEAGSGKSTFTKHVFLRCLQEGKNIPLFIELRYVSSEQKTIEQYIWDLVENWGLAESKRIVEKFLLAGKFTIFFDGYDELTSDDMNRVSKEIVVLCEKYPDTRMLVTSRPHTEAVHLPLFSNYKMKSLMGENSKDIQGFIRLQLKNEEEMAEKIVESIANAQKAYVKDFLGNPLLLSLYILTYQNNPEIPSKKHIFYRRVIDTLFSEHDAKTKLGFRREKSCGLSQEQFESVLKAFSFMTFFSQEFSWTKADVYKYLEKIKKMYDGVSCFSSDELIEDLKVAISLWVEDGGILSFSHRSLQEYFSSVFIKEIEDKEQKSRIYNEISGVIQQKSSMREIENFLSICEEVDCIDFNDFYYIPHAKEILNICDDSGFESFFKWFIHSFFVFPAQENDTSKNISMAAQVHPHVYRSIYVHYAMTAPIHSSLMNDFEKAWKEGNGESDMVYDEDDEIYMETLRAGVNGSAYKLYEKMINKLEQQVSVREAYKDEVINAPKKMIDELFG